MDKLVACRIVFLSSKQYASMLTSLVASSLATTSPRQLRAVWCLAQCALASASSFLRDMRERHSVSYYDMLLHLIAIGDAISSGLSFFQGLGKSHDHERIYSPLCFVRECTNGGGAPAAAILLGANPRA